MIGRAALLWAALLGACATPPLNKALVVRDIAGKCALIAFSGCASLESQRAPAAAEDDDAGVER